MLVKFIATVSTVGLASAVTGGCGLAFMSGPPAGHEQMDYFHCTESNTYAVADVIMAALTALNVGYGLSVDERELRPYDRNTFVGLNLVMLATSGVSAATGFRKAKDCRDAKRQLAARQAARLRPAAPEGDLAVHSVVVSPPVDTLLIASVPLRLVAFAYDSSGALISVRAFRWTSSNDAIASVSPTGVVTAHAEGAVVIAANVSGAVGTARILVMVARP